MDSDKTSQCKNITPSNRNILKNCNNITNNLSDPHNFFHTETEKSVESDSENYCLNNKQTSEEELEFLNYYNYLIPHPSFSENIRKGIFTNDEYTILHEHKLDFNSEKNKNYNFSNFIPEEPEEILIFIVHGIGQSEENLKKILNERIKLMVEILYEKDNPKFSSSLHFRMIDWKTPLNEREKENFNDLVNKNNKSKFPKMFIQNVPLDLMQFMSERNKYKIINDVVSQINSYYHLVKKYRRNFKGNVSIIGHSLGSVIMYEILSNMTINEKYRNFGLNKNFSLGEKEFFKKVFNQDILEKNFEKIFFERVSAKLNNKSDKKKDKDEEKNKLFRISNLNNLKEGENNNFIQEKLDKDKIMNKESVKNISLNHDELKFSFKDLKFDNLRNKLNNETLNDKTDILNTYNGNNIHEEEKYLSEFLLIKRNDRRNTLSKIKIVDENDELFISEEINEKLPEIKLNETFQNSGKADYKEIIITENKIKNGKEIIVRLNNDLIIKKLDKKRLDLKIKVKIEKEDHKSEKKIDTIKNDKTPITAILESVRDPIKLNTSFTSLNKKKEDKTSKFTGLNLDLSNNKNYSSNKFDKISNEFKTINTDPNNLEKTKKLKDDILNTSSLQNNEEQIKINKNTEIDLNSKKIFGRRRETKTIPLDEIRNTIGSFYSKIKNVNLVNITKQQRNFELNEILEKHLFDYKRRIYLKTQHKIFLENKNNENSDDKSQILYNNNNTNLETDYEQKLQYITLNSTIEDFTNECNYILFNKNIDYHRYFRVYSKHKKILPMIFSIEHFFLIGSPLSLFLTIERGKKPFLYEMESIKDFHNIIHPMDPVAYRIEHLIYDYDMGKTSCVLPHFLNKGIKNVFLSKILNIIFFNSEDEKDNEFYSSNKKRYDYILQESIPEKTINVIGFLYSHMKYWNNPDVFYFILDVIHSQ